MVSLQSAEQALKSFYLDAVKDSIDTKTSPFVAAIESSSSNVFGKDVKKVIRAGFNNAIISGSETGDLPAADQASYIQLSVGLKNLYGRIEISDKAIRAAQSNEGAFVNLLNDEMDTLLKGAKYNFSRMVMGDGTGFLTGFGKAIEPAEIQVYHVEVIQPGMRVVMMNGDDTPAEGGLVRSVLVVDRNNCLVKLSGGEIPDNLTNPYLIMAHNEAELTGLKAIFNNKNLYGMTDEEYMKVRPFDWDFGDEFDEMALQVAIDQIEQASNTAPNLIICSYGVRRAIVSYYKEQGVILPTMEIEGGFKALSYNGIPIVADRFCEPGTIYLVNTDDFKLCQLCDWEWMESEDGKILHQVPGKPVYTATLVKYAELICDRPNAQGRVTSIVEK